MTSPAPPPPSSPPSAMVSAPNSAASENPCPVDSPFVPKTAAASPLQEPAFALQGFPPSIAPQLLRNVTSASASAKLLLLGYSDGSVALFDVYGYLVEHHVGRHDAPVTSVALGGGATADDIAVSAAADGTFRASPLFENSSNSAAVLSARTGFRARAGAALVAIAVDPEYGKPRSGERVAHADSNGRVVLYQSGWFGGSETLVSKPDGNVQSMCWSGFLLAWAMLTGVRIYDARLGQTVCFVESPVAVPQVQPSISGIPNLDGADKSSSETEGELRRAPSTDSLLQGPSSWEWVTSLRFEADEKGPLSAYGECTQTLYVAWPSAAKVITIGPHMNPEKGSASSSQAPTAEREQPPLAPRLVETSLIISRAQLPVDGGEDKHLGADALASPILGIAPFGEEHVCVLVGTVFHGLSLVQVPRIGDSSTSGNSSNGGALCMPLPQGNVRSAELHAIVGGEPYVLVVSHKADAVEDSSETEGFEERAVAFGVEGEHPVANSSMQELTSIANSPASAKDERRMGNVDESPEGAASPRRNSFAQSESGSAVASSCVLFARTLGVAERIKWMLEHGRFESAVALAEDAPRGSLRRADLSIADVGDQFLESIRAKSDFELLAKVLPRIIVSTSPSVAIRGHEKVMQIRSKRWVDWIKIFREAGTLDLVAKSVPSYEPRLRQTQYNDILIELASSNPAAMLGVLKTWPGDVYDVAAVTRAVETQCTVLNDSTEAAGESGKSDSREAIREGLFMLYGLSGRHDETLNLLLQERSTRVFNYITSHDLYEAIRSDVAIRGMYEVSMTNATGLLVNAPATLLPIEAVVPILNSIGNREWLCSYLYTIFRQDPERCSQFHGQLLEALLEHGPEGALYNFLKTSTNFSLDTALNLMGGRRGNGDGSFGRERVFVLATMGDLNAAMSILLGELHDVHGAIDFASEHGDKALWDRLIEHARGDANTLAALLDSPAGGKVNPVRLIPLIAEDMDIPHLRDRLHGILIDAALERELREETAAALHFDAGKLMAALDGALVARAPD